MVVKKSRVKSRRGNVVTVNFSGVESGGRRCPDGTYEAEIISAELEESSSGNPMIVAKWKITDGKFKGVQLFDNISLVPQALWKLKTLLEALGIEPQEEDVAASEYASEMLEKGATIIVTNEKYEGEDRPKVTGYGEPEEGNGAEESEDDEESEDEEEARPSRRKSAVRAKSNDEDEEESDEQDGEESEEEEDEEEPKVRNRGGRIKIKEGSRVKFKDDDGKTIRGTVTSLDKGEAVVEDKNGDEYQLDAGLLTVL